MAWRGLDEADLAGTLSQKELDAFRQSASNDGRDPVADLLSRTAEMARGYCRANRSCRVAEGAGLVPESLASACCDYAAYDVLKRLPVPVGEDRRRAREQALELFRAVAKGDITPEDPAGADSATPAGAPLAAPASPPRMLD